MEQRYTLEQPFSGIGHLIPEFSEPPSRQHSDLISSVSRASTHFRCRRWSTELIEPPASFSHRFRSLDTRPQSVFECSRMWWNCVEGSIYILYFLPVPLMSYPSPREKSHPTKGANSLAAYHVQSVQLGKQARALISFPRVFCCCAVDASA